MTGTDVVNIIKEFGTQTAIVIGLVITALGAWKQIKTQAATAAADKVAEVKNVIEQAVGTEGDGTVRSALQRQDEKMAAHVARSEEFRRDIRDQVGDLAEQVRSLNALMVKIATKMSTGVAE